jgi:hypothetical protein
MRFGSPFASIASIYLLLALGAACNLPAALPTAAPATSTPAVARPAPPPLPDTGPRLSEFGWYAGYSETRFDHWGRTSQYVTMSDGVRLAVDILRPQQTRNGPFVAEPLPVVWLLTRLHRAFTWEDRVYAYPDIVPDTRVLLEHGYGVVVVDARGTGASFGRYAGYNSDQESRDSYEITEWIAAQPWCNGRIGMSGSGYMASAQLQAASLAPPHLRAIFPASTLFDSFDLPYPGGAYRRSLIEGWAEATAYLDTQHLAPPVDEDPTGRLRDAAQREHRRNWDPASVEQFPFRSDEPGAQFSTADLLTDVAGVNRSGVAVYLWTGWLDGYVRDTLLWYANLTTPKKLALGPWEANPSRKRGDMLSEFNKRNVEQLRWFDYWLKGIENGVLAEPAIHYVLNNKLSRWRWQQAEAWPLPEVFTTTLYLASGPAGSVASANDGALAAQPPDAGADDYAVDAAATTGQNSRWANLLGQALLYPDLMPNDARGLTYTMPVLGQDVTVLGSPIVTLYLSTAAPDLDVFAYLEEVEPSGVSNYVTEGQLRASHRALAAPPYATLGLPYHPSRAQDLSLPPADAPVQLVFDLLPTGNVFNAGNRLRLTLTGADADQIEALPWAEGAALRLLRGGPYPSALQLPVWETK